MPYIIAKPSDMENTANRTLTEMIAAILTKSGATIYPKDIDTKALFKALSDALPTSVHTDKSTDFSDIIDVRPMTLTIEQSTNIYALLANAPDIQRLWALGTITGISFHFQVILLSESPIFSVAAQSTGNDQRVLNLTDTEYVQLVAALPQPSTTVDDEDEIACIDIALDQQDTIMTALSKNPNGLPHFYEDIRALFDEATKFYRTQFAVFPN